jgi:hypothetical protein
MRSWRLPCHASPRITVPSAAGIDDMTRNHRTIDAELGLIAALRRSARFRGGPLPANERINDLLDERLSAVHAAEPSAWSAPSCTMTVAPSALG